MKLTIAGSNHYLMRRRLDELTDEFVNKHGDLAIERIDGTEAEPQAVIDAVQSPPFLSARKLVMVRDLSQSKPTVELVEQIISSISEAVDLVIYEPQIDKRTAYFKELKKLTELEEYGALDGPELVKWLVLEAAARGGQLSSSDANTLVERIGENQSLLSNELDKLITYEPAISRQTIELLSAKTPQSRVFDLLDAAFSGNKRRALELYEEQRVQKVEPQAILALIVWQLQLITLADLGRGKNSAQIAADAGVSPYPLGKAQRLAASLGSVKLRELVNEAHRLDKLGKSKAIEMDEVLKTYIATT